MSLALEHSRLLVRELIINLEMATRGASSRPVVKEALKLLIEQMNHLRPAPGVTDADMADLIAWAEVEDAQSEEYLDTDDHD